MWFYISIIIALLWAINSWLTSFERQIKKRDKISTTLYDLAFDNVSKQVQDDRDYKNDVQKETYKDEVEKLQKIKQMSIVHNSLQKKFKNDQLKRLEISNDWLIYSKAIHSSELPSVRDEDSDSREKSLAQASEIEKRFDYLLDTYRIV